MLSAKIQADKIFDSAKMQILEEQFLKIPGLTELFLTGILFLDLKCEKNVNKLPTFKYFSMLLTFKKIL